MVGIIIFAIVVVGGFFTRKIWGGYIVLLVSRLKKGKTKTLAVSDTQDGIVFAPRGTIRTFVVAFDIQEMGDGTAKISLAKIKDVV